MTAQSHYEEIHPSQDPNRPFPCNKCALKFVRKNHIFRHEQAYHTTKNIHASVMKGISPAITAKNGSGNHEREAKWCQMSKVQKTMSIAVAQAVHQRSSVTRPADRANTTSAKQRQVGKEDKSPNAYQANEAQQIREGRTPRGNVSTQTRAYTDLIWKCDEAGCGRMYAQLIQPTNHYKDNHSELGLN